MTSIKIEPITPKMRADVETKIELSFNFEATGNLHRDLEHAAKRAAAKAYLAGEGSEHIEAEAALRGVQPRTFAEMIAAKPDNVVARWMRRQSAILRVRNAKTRGEIEAVLKELGAKP